MKGNVGVETVGLKPHGHCGTGILCCEELAKIPEEKSPSKRHCNEKCNQDSLEGQETCMKECEEVSKKKHFTFGVCCSVRTPIGVHTP